MGIQIEHIAFAELNDAWKAADKDEARAVAEGWTQAAQKVEGVSRETLEASAAMYLAEKAVMKKHGASGITINCLGGFYGGHIHAYPCLGFHQLNNEALVGGCECDVRSAATMLAGTILTQGRPGYISDPVIDTAKRQIIYAHCVAANKAFGPEGPANAFEILTHSEDRQGASVRSLLPVDYMTTTLECDPGKKAILFHRAQAVANDPDDRACRTKLCAEPVGDIEKLFAQWDHWGWHRVTFYGDLKAPNPQHDQTRNRHRGNPPDGRSKRRGGHLEAPDIPYRYTSRLIPRSSQNQPRLTNPGSRGRLRRSVSQDRKPGSLK
jgi:hypothetical protein